MTEKIMWELPLTTVSEANSSEHWTKSSKRHRQQQFFVRAMFHGLKTEIPIPCTITLTRLNSRGLDKSDNLPMAFKYIKDEIVLFAFFQKIENLISLETERYGRSRVMVMKILVFIGNLLRKKAKH